MQTQNNPLLPGNLLRLDLLFAGLTAILIGYFLVWLPGPSVGLQLIGIEIGEWIKFLGVGPRRNWFYLPPIVIGLCLALLAATWPNNRWQTWLLRILAIGVSLLAMPAVSAILLEARSEWLTRVISIVFVVVVVIAGAAVGGGNRQWRGVWLLIAVVALAGAVLPTIQYLAIQPVIEGILLQPVGIGPGVWLNAIGSILVVMIGVLEFRDHRKIKTAIV